MIDEKISFEDFMKQCDIIENYIYGDSDIDYDLVVPETKRELAIALKSRKDGYMDGIKEGKMNVARELLYTDICLNEILEVTGLYKEK